MVTGASLAPFDEISADGFARSGLGAGVAVAGRQPRTSAENRKRWWWIRDARLMRTNKLSQSSRPKLRLCGIRSPIEGARPYNPTVNGQEGAGTRPVNLVLYLLNGNFQKKLAWGWTHMRGI